MTPWKKIRAVTFDIDGVMTDGGLIPMESGEFLRIFNAKDSFALRAAAMKGYKLGVFTGGKSLGILNRMLSAGLKEEDIYMNCRGKISSWEDFCRRHGLKPEEVLYVGDDIPDLQIMRAAGIGVAPFDAADDVIEEADYICDKGGGKGCIREVIEKMMTKAGCWNFDDFEKIF